MKKNTLKRLLSAVVLIAMLIGCIPFGTVIAFAAAPASYTDITVYGSKTVSVNGNSNYFRFVPERGGTYEIYSYDNSGNPFVYLLDSSGTAVAYDNNSAGDSNFKLQYRLEAGATYYIEACSYDDQYASYKIRIVDVELDAVANSNILADEEKTVSVGRVGTEFCFIPDQSGIYEIYSYNNSGDPYISLLNASRTSVLDSDDDSGDDGNFKLQYRFEAGRTYYINPRSALDTATYTFKISPVELDETGTSEDIETPEEPEVSEGADIWDGSIDTSWYNNYDTEFVINTAEELAGLAQLVNSGDTFSGKTVYLGNDIDLSNREWAPIGKNMLSSDYAVSSTAFSGVFDGCYHTIHNLYIANNDTSFAGLFGKVSGATIRNVQISTADVRNVVGGSYRSKVGALIGFARASLIQSCGVFDATVFAETTGNPASAGGLIGLICESTIENSFAYADVYSNGHTAGLIGACYEGRNTVISNCYAVGSVSSINYGPSSVSKCISGILAYGSGSITNCVYIGEFYDSYGFPKSALAREASCSNCYYNISTYGYSFEPDSFMSQSWVESYLGWDFDDVWVFDADCDYPVLSGFSEGGYTPHAHSYEETSRTDATCVQEGVIISTCSVCGRTREEILSIIDHNYVLQSTTAADCVNNGVEIYECSMCGDCYENVVDWADGHYYENGYCTYCGEHVISDFTIIEADSSAYVDIPDIYGEVYFKFIPTVSGQYRFYSSNKSGDPRAALLNGSGEQIAYDDDGGNNGNFSIYYDCEANTTYYIKAYMWSSNTGYYTLNVVTIQVYCDHDYTLDSTTAADCYNDGIATYVCSLCGNSYTEVVEYALGHDYVLQSTTAADCVNNGVEVYACTRCDDSYENVVDWAHGHYYENGYCTYCGEHVIPVFTTIETNSSSYVEITDSCDAVYFKFVPTVSGRYRFYSTNYYGDPFVWVLDANGEYLTSDDDSGASWNFSVDYDCEANVTYYIKAGMNGYNTGSYSFYVQTVYLYCDHDYTLDSTTAADCYNDGIATYVCSLCGNSYTEVVEYALGHDYVLQGTTEADCVNNGVEIYACTRCGDSYEYIVDWAHGHFYENGYCTYCGEHVIPVFTIIEADSSAYVDIPNVYGVVYFKFIPTVSGRYRFYSSNNSGDPFAALLDGSGNEITYNDDGANNGNFSIYYDCAANTTYYIKAYMWSSNTGYYTLNVVTIQVYCDHDYTLDSTTAADCYNDGTVTYVCSLCGDSYTEVVEWALGHDYVLQSATEADCVNNGVEVYACTRCGDSYENVVDWAHGHYYENGYCTYCGGYIFADAIVIESGESFYVDESGYVYFQFTPTASGEYQFYSTNYSGDPFAELLDANGNYLTSNDDGGYSWNFSISYACQANQTYFIKAYNYSGYYTFNIITIEIYCDHEYYVESSTAADCYNDGIATYVCSLCGESYTDVFEYALGHDYILQSATAADCVNNGVEIYACTRCDDSYSVVAAPALRHDYVDGTCTRCGCPQPEADIWDGTADTSWYNNLDTEFTISTAEQLAGLAQLVNNGYGFYGKTIHLDNNIDLDGLEWTPIGQNGTYTFSGTFVGNNYLITNLTINGNNRYAGLFGCVSSTNISNVGLRNVNINISYSGSDAAIGGLVGYHISGTISGCFMEGNVSASGSGQLPTGGLIGIFSSGSLINCYAISTVSSNSIDNAPAGGLIGATGWYHNETVNITNCFAISTVVSYSSTSMARAGGLIGDNYASTCRLNQCYTINCNVSSGNSKDAILGYKYSGSVYMVSCYYADANVGANYGGSVASADDLKSQAWIEYNLGWDFDTVWYIGEDADHPILAGFEDGDYTPHVHSYEETSRTDATCVQEGVIISTCSVCGRTREEILPIIDHNYVLQGTTEADCVNNGVEIYECSMCGDCYENVVDWADGHYYENGYCIHCGEHIIPVFTTIETNSSSYVEIVDSYGAVYFKFVPTVSGRYSFFSTSYSGDPYVWLLDENGNTLTYNDDGGESLNFNLYYECTANTTYFIKAGMHSSNIGSYNLNVHVVEIYCDHDYTLDSTTAADCYNDGIATYVCSLCGNIYTEVVEYALGHDYVLQSTTAADCVNSGMETYTCSRCNDSYEVVIRALGHNYENGICIRCGAEGSGSILVIRDNEPWGYNSITQMLDSLLEANMIEKWDGVHTLDVTAEMLHNYAVVYVANDQSSSAQSRIKAMKSMLEEYVSGGGILIFGFLSMSSTSEYGSSLPGGVTARYDSDDYNYIADATHPIITGVLSDNVVLTNADMIGSSASHDYIVASTLPEGSRVIVTDSYGRPTVAEYNIGAGTVIATGMTWEYYWYNSNGNFASKAYDDLFLYAISIANGWTTPDDAHIAGDWIVDSESTCTTPGSRHIECVECGAILRTEEIPATGHVYGEWIVDTEAGCTISGTKYSDCSECGEGRIWGYIPAIGHNYNSELTRESTCTTPGIMTYTCQNCGDSYDVYIHSEHNYVHSNRVEPTCTADGEDQYTCTRCGDSYGIVISGGHDYIAEIEIIATPTTPGEMGYTCSKCGDYYTEEIPARPNAEILLVQDRLPWSENNNVALLDAMMEAGYIDGWDITTTANFASVDLTRFNVILIANDQTTATYNQLRILQDSLVMFARAGGVVIYGACDNGWAGGEISHTLPEGVVKNNYYSHYNYIVDTSHPIVLGSMTDGKALTNNLLYGNYCSHSSFDLNTLPDGANVILQDGRGDPTLVEYAVGEGYVILSGLTWEFYYTRGAYDYRLNTTYTRNVYDDLIVYAASLSSGCEHAWGEGVVVDPTCTDRGYTLHECALCERTLKENYTDATGHILGDWEIVTPATTEAAGLKAKYCSECGEIIVSEVLPILNAATIIVEALGDSVVLGEEITFTVVISGADPVKSMALLPIFDTDYFELVDVAWTVNAFMVSIEEGTLRSVAVWTNETDVNTTVYRITLRAKALTDATAVDFTAKLEDASQGIIVASVVGKTVAIIECPHSENDYINMNDGYHAYTCVLCGYTRMEAHVYDDACDEDCDLCGKVRVAIHDVSDNWFSDANNHWTACSLCGEIVYQSAHVFNSYDTSERYLASAATCNSAATYYVSCAECGERGTETFSHGDPLVHDFAGWSYSETQHWHECANCGYSEDLEDHVFSLSQSTCDVCGYAKYVLGDADNDGDVDSEDATYLLYHIFFGETGEYPIYQSCDFDGSGETDSDDAVYLLYNIFFGETGDYPLYDIVN